MLIVKHFRGLFFIYMVIQVVFFHAGKFIHFWEPKWKFAKRVCVLWSIVLLGWIVKVGGYPYSITVPPSSPRAFTSSVTGITQIITRNFWVRGGGGEGRPFLMEAAISRPSGVLSHPTLFRWRSHSIIFSGGFNVSDGRLGDVLRRHVALCRVDFITSKMMERMSS